MASQQPAPVVVGFDGSPGAWTALRAAAWEARSRRIPLRVVHGFEQPLTTFGPDVLAQYGIETVARGARQMLDEAAAEVSHRYPGVEVTTAVVSGRAAGVLVEESRDASLMVLGSRGRAAVLDVLAGSVGTQVATHGSGPVVVVPPQDGCGGQTPFTSNARVVVGVDGSSGSTEATAFAVEEAVARGGGLTAVYAWTAPETQAAERDARQLDPAGCRHGHNRC